MQLIFEFIGFKLKCNTLRNYLNPSCYSFHPGFTLVLIAGTAGQVPCCSSSQAAAGSLLQLLYFLNRVKVA
jgi:hypothetical protein